MCASAQNSSARRGKLAHLYIPIILDNDNGVLIMISPKQIWTLMKESVVAWKKDRAPSMGAALAYYTAFSIAPLLIIVIAVAGLVYGHDVAQAAVLAQLQGLVGEDGGEAIDAMVTSAGDLGSGIFKTIIGVYSRQ
jgi:membrane protein